MTKHIKIKNSKELTRLLGLTPEEGVELEFRAQLCLRIAQIVKKKGITHAEVANLSGASRTRITAILNGSTKGVSTDMLLRILYSLGYRIKASFTASKIAA